MDPKQSRVIRLQEEWEQAVAVSGEWGGRQKGRGCPYKGVGMLTVS